MRVATEEEDILLQNISNYEKEIYNLENEVMVCEAQVKGYREKRRQLRVKFICVFIVMIFFTVLSFGYLIHIRGNWRFTVAMFLGSGGLGIFAAIYYVYAFIFMIKFFAALSSSNFWAEVADKINVENIVNGETANKIRLSNIKRTIAKDREQLDIDSQKYFYLKAKEDKIFEEEIASGKRKIDFNFDAYNSYVEVTNEWITFNKLRVEQLKLSNRKKVLEKDVEDMVLYEEKCKKNLIWTVILFIALLAIAAMFVVMGYFETEYLDVIRGLIILTLIVAGTVAIVCFVNFVTKLPYLSGSGLACEIAEVLLIDKTKKDFNDMVKEIEACNTKIHEVADEINRMKEIMAKQKEEGFQS